MLRQLIIVALMSGLAAAVAEAQDDVARVVVEDPFIELRTGAAEVYPVFFVVDRGEQIEVLQRRTDWFKVRAPARAGRMGR